MDPIEAAKAKLAEEAARRRAKHARTSERRPAAPQPGPPAAQGVRPADAPVASSPPPAAAVAPGASPAAPAPAPPASPPASKGEVAPGARIGDRYVVERLLAKGGMGAVYVALDERMGTRVAVKVAAAGGAAADEFARRFAREARIGGRLGQRPGFVGAMDWGRIDDVRLFLAMPLIEGARPLDLRTGDLAARVGRWRRAAEIVKAAHEAGVVHRDLKPQNFLAAPDGAIYLTDFGLAKIVGEADDGEVSSTITRTGAGFGTAPYMPPEQLEDSKRADERADVYALGVMLFEALTGRLPYPGATPSEVIYLQMRVRAGVVERPAPRQVNGSLPKPLSDACTAAIALEAEGRTQSVAALLHQVAAQQPPPSAGPRPPTGRKVPAAAAPTVVAPPSLASRAGVAGDSPRWSPWAFLQQCLFWGFIAAVLSGLLGIAGKMVMRTPKGADPPVELTPTPSPPTRRPPRPTRVPPPEVSPTELELQRRLAEQEGERSAAEKERQRLLAEQERERAAAAEERARLVAEQDRQREAAEQEIERLRQEAAAKAAERRVGCKHFLHASDYAHEHDVEVTLVAEHPSHPEHQSDPLHPEGDPRHPEGHLEHPYDSTVRVGTVHQYDAIHEYDLQHASHSVVVIYQGVPITQEIPCNHKIACSHLVPCGHEQRIEDRSPCTHPVACRHMRDCKHPVQCQHRLPCRHRKEQRTEVPCVHQVPCTHTQHESDLETGGH